MQHLDDTPQNPLLLVVNGITAQFLGCSEQSRMDRVLRDRRRFCGRQNDGGAPKNAPPLLAPCGHKEKGSGAPDDLSQGAALYEVGTAEGKPIPDEVGWVKALDFSIAAFMFAHVSVPAFLFKSALLSAALERGVLAGPHNIDRSGPRHRGTHTTRSTGWRQLPSNETVRSRLELTSRRRAAILAAVVDARALAS